MNGYFVAWGGHVKNGFNNGRVWSNAVSSDEVAREDGFANEKFHFVNVQHDLFFKAFKYCDKLFVLVNSCLCSIGTTIRD